MNRKDLTRNERTATITLTDGEIFFLSEKYGTRKGVKKLVECAVLEAVAASANDYLAKKGYTGLSKEDGNGSEH